MFDATGRSVPRQVGQDLSWSHGVVSKAIQFLLQLGMNFLVELIQNGRSPTQ